MTVPLPSWSVTGMTPTVKLMPGANPTEGYDFHFETNNGVNGSVFVAKAQVSDTDTVKELIITEIMKLSAIRHLSG